MADLTKKKPTEPPPVAPPKPPAIGIVGSGGSGGGGGFVATPKVRTLELKGHVGFDSLPQQLVQKATAHGFVFNILCVGETGIGKSTLMESLFNMPLGFEQTGYELKTVELRKNSFEMKEAGVNLKLTVVETAGFGDQLGKDGSAKIIADFLNEQYELYLQEELKIRRCLELYHDTRIHACLYFISPTGHGLKALDVTTLKELSKKVNVIPVIAKSDTTSKEELKRFKEKILKELKENGIQVYHFPTDDETVRATNENLNAAVPFAVVGSTDFVKKGGKQIRARNYPWGVVEVENEEHCDFVKLREALLRTNVEDLRERTHSTLYESYRRQRLREMGLKDGETGPGLGGALDERLRSHKLELERREEEAKAAFVKRVETREAELKAEEKATSARYEDRIVRLEAELRGVQEKIQEADKELAYLQQQHLQQVAKQTGKKHHK